MHATGFNKRLMTESSGSTNTENVLFIRLAANRLLQGEKFCHVHSMLGNGSEP